MVTERWCRGAVMPTIATADQALAAVREFLVSSREFTDQTALRDALQATPFDGGWVIRPPTDLTAIGQFAALVGFDGAIEPLPSHLPPMMAKAEFTQRHGTRDQHPG
jgi:hypothetical protein